LELPVPRIWAGLDIGKGHHHCVVLDADGRKLLSRKVSNDEPELLGLIGDVLALDEEVLWAVDLNHGGAALVIALLLDRGQEVTYLTGLAIHLASATYSGEGKTDAKDAFVIADQARMRRDLARLRPGDAIAVDLRLLTARRTDLVQDRTRGINRLRAALLEVFPALERELDLNRKGPVVLLTKYQTPAAIRRAGTRRIETWLRGSGVRTAATLAGTAVEAAKSQRTSLPGEDLAAALIARLARALIALNEEIREVEDMIEARFRQHPHAEVILSLPGMGPRLGAEFIAATGGDLDAFGSVDRLAGFAGLAPAPRDSGRISGNLRRPRRYNRVLLRVCYLSAMASLKSCAASRIFYSRKRTEGKGHKQALIALARRRLNVLWAMIRTGTAYTEPQPIKA
jgi:transposase